MPWSSHAGRCRPRWRSFRARRSIPMGGVGTTSGWRSAGSGTRRSPKEPRGSAGCSETRWGAEHMTDSGAYFARQTGDAAGQARYVDIGELPSIEIVPGLVFRPVLGERVLVNFVWFEPHTEAPVHTHEEEQVVVVLE